MEVRTRLVKTHLILGPFFLLLEVILTSFLAAQMKGEEDRDKSTRDDGLASLTGGYMDRLYIFRQSP